MRPRGSARIPLPPVSEESTDVNETDIQTRARQLGHLVGNTPLLSIHFSTGGRERVIHAKAENLNMTGSIKDRMALHIVKQSYQRGLLKPGVPMFEATSGNTGISFCAIGR